MTIYELLKEIIKMFDKLNIPYLLSGSLAFNIYAIPRATRDIDIVIELKEKGLGKFISELEGKYYYNEETIKEEIKRRGMFNIIHLATSFKVDLIVRNDSLFELKKFERIKKTMIDDLEINVISAEDLILSKLIWIQELESEIQKNDIKMLMENKNMDIDYIRYWIKDMKLKTYNLFKV